MNQPTEHLTFQQIISGVVELCEEVAEFLEWLEDGLQSAAQTDVRYHMLGSMRDDYCSALWIIGGLTMVTASDDRINEFLTMVDQQKTKQEIDLAFTDYVRRTVVTRIYFLGDHLLGCLSKNIDGRRDRTVHGNITKVIGNYSGLNHDVADAFYAMGYTRNAFHNNGIHNRATVSFEIDGRKFDFVNGQEVALSWEDVRTLVYAVIRGSLKVSREFGKAVAIAGT